MIPSMNPAFASLLPTCFIPFLPNIIANTPAGNVTYQNAENTIESIPNIIEELFLFTL